MPIVEFVEIESIRSDLTLEIAVRSLRSPTGCGRPENQDNYLIINGKGQARTLWHEQEIYRWAPDWPDGHQRIAVLDGMGGSSQGREATERTIEGLLAIPAATDVVILSSALDGLHERLFKECQAAELETGCTLILLEIPPDKPALLFHVGDSRLYVVDEQQAQCLTVDHVPTTHRALLGLLDGAQWLQQVHCRANSQISQAFILGGTLASPDIYTDRIDADLLALNDGNLPLFLRGLNDRRAVRLEPDRVYLLASDGLWHLHDPQAFIQRWPTLLARPECSLEEAMDALFDELVAAISQQDSQPDDNCTVILIRCKRQLDSLLPEIPA
jgi:serine/threonine protein phosphatase PrpC